MDRANERRQATRPDVFGRGAGFIRRVVCLAPGEELEYDDAEWSDALVIIERGALDLECRAGGHRRFTGGDILWMEGLELRWLRNPGEATTVLVAISRRSPLRGPLGPRLG